VYTIATFAQKDTARYERWCGYAPELVHAAPDATLLYVPAQQQVALDLEALPSAARLYLLIDDNAHVLCKHALNDDLHLTIIVAPHARVHYDLRHMNSAARRLRLELVQQRASMAQINGLSSAPLDGAITLHMRDHHAQAEVRMVAFANAANESTLCTLQDHAAPETKSSVQLKTVLAGMARYTHHGMLDVAYGATGVVAYEQSDHMLMASTARAHVVPAMQVRNHDVQCTHASALGTVDTQLLWYMQARGIAEQEARMLMLHAYLMQMCHAYPDFADAVHNALETFVGTGDYFSKKAAEHGITTRSV
jgi:Fe-S cluster assembly scaffold protein SufB